MRKMIVGINKTSFYFSANARHNLDPFGAGRILSGPRDRNYNVRASIFEANYVLNDVGFRLIVTKSLSTMIATTLAAKAMQQHDIVIGKVIRLKLHAV